MTENFRGVLKPGHFHITVYCETGLWPMEKGVSAVHVVLWAETALLVIGGGLLRKLGAAGSSLVESGRKQNVFLKINISHNLRKESASCMKFERCIYGAMCNSLAWSKHS